MTLVGTGEIEEQHGIDRVQVFRLVAAGDWPEAEQDLKRGKLWDANKVAAKVEELRRAGRLTIDGRIVPWRYLERSTAKT